MTPTPEQIEAAKEIMRAGVPSITDNGEVRAAQVLATRDARIIAEVRATRDANAQTAWNLAQTVTELKKKLAAAESKVREQSELIIELGAKLNATKLREETAESRATAQALAAAELRKMLDKAVSFFVRSCNPRTCRNKSTGQWVCRHPEMEELLTSLSKFPATPDEAEAGAMREVVEAAKAWRTHHVCCPKDCPDLKGAEKALGDSLDALARLTAKEQKS